MAGRKGGKVKTGIRILMWLLAVVAAFILLLILMQQLKLINLQKYIPGAGDSSLPSMEELSSMDLLDHDRLSLKVQANEQRAEELDVQASGLKDLEIKLEEQRKQLEKERNAVEEEKKRLQEEQKLYDKKKETMTRTASELRQMEVQKAVDRLVERDNQDIIWIMKITDEQAAEAGSFSEVPTWLSTMDASRAAEIQRERDLIPDSEFR